MWGVTIEHAATAYLRDTASRATSLETLTSALRGAMLADLPEAIQHLLDAVTNLAAGADVRSMMAAVPPLVDVARYGDVRETEASTVTPVIHSLTERVLVELPGACLSVDDEAATQLLNAASHLHDALRVFGDGDLQSGWYAMLRGFASDQIRIIHPLIAGWSCRVLLEAGKMTDSEVEQLARLALSSVTPTDNAAAWIQGLLHGGGAALIYADSLWRSLDRWVCDLDGSNFEAVLPLMRRSFSAFADPERQAMADRVRRLHQQGHVNGHAVTTELRIDLERANLVLPVLAHILGVRLDD